MSNCISIRDGRVLFSHGEIDALALIEELKKHKDCAGFDLHRKDENEEWACSMAQWFLVPGKNLYMTEGSASMKLVVEFGYGNSSHTWRDFGSTVLFLDKFMKTIKSHRFQLRDDDMGGGRLGGAAVVFIPGEKKHVYLSDMRKELAAVEAELLKLGIK